MIQLFTLDSLYLKKNKMQSHVLYDDTKRNSCVYFALSNTRLKMYGKGTKIDEIRESATIDTSFNISRLNVAIAFKFLEHVKHIIHNTCVKFQ